MEIDAAFPGGNVIVESLDAARGEAVLRPDLRDTAGHWFYWCFRVRGAAGRRLRIRFSVPHCLGALGPAQSLGYRSSWFWLGRDCMETDPEDGSESFTCQIPTRSREVFFAMAFPYTEVDWQAFLFRYLPQHPVQVLCHSRQGRPVEMLTLRHPTQEPRRTVLITARHHACESMASYVLEGLATALLDPETRAPLEETQFIFLPFMDKDGVENGDQGKNRQPHDHNRNYGGTSLYPEPAALRQRAATWREGPAPVVLALDLHCPWLRGGLNEKLYLVGQEGAPLWAEQQRLATCIEAACAEGGPLRLRAADSLPFGQAWNTVANYAAGVSFARWATGPELAAPCAATLEIPYANADGITVDANSARALGRDLLRGVDAFLNG